jgi:nucleoside 2-deoxyribosyltransferase
VPVFADDVPTGTPWSMAIQEMLREADLVIADVTEAGPNAMIEVGMALGMGKRLLLLSQSGSTDLPMELRAQQVAVYRPGDMGSIRRYRELSLRDSLAERVATDA